MNTFHARLEALSAGRNRVSRAYTVAAWILIAAAALFWLPFATAAVGFLWGGFLLKREGL